MGLTYEEVRKFYDGSEQREQKLIVMTQKLMEKVKKLEQGNRYLKQK